MKRERENNEHRSFVWANGEFEIVLSNTRPIDNEHTQEASLLIFRTGRTLIQLPCCLQQQTPEERKKGQKTRMRKLIRNEETHRDKDVTEKWQTD